MRKEREALLIAALAGLVIVGAAAFVVQPGFGEKPAQSAIHLSDTGSVYVTGVAASKSA
jgi:hypothetical protein